MGNTTSKQIGCISHYLNKQLNSAINDYWSDWRQEPELAARIINHLQE